MPPSSTSTLPQYHDNIWGYLWGKLAYGARLFATALTNDSIADSLANPATAICISPWRRK